MEIFEELAQREVGLIDKEIEDLEKIMEQMECQGLVPSKAQSTGPISQKVKLNYKRSEKRYQYSELVQDSPRPEKKQSRPLNQLDKKYLLWNMKKPQPTDLLNKKFLCLEPLKLRPTNNYQFLLNSDSGKASDCYT